MEGTLKLETFPNDADAFPAICARVKAVNTAVGAGGPGLGAYHRVGDHRCGVATATEDQQRLHGALRGSKNCRWSLRALFQIKSPEIWIEHPSRTPSGSESCAVMNPRAGCGHQGKEQFDA